MAFNITNPRNSNRIVEKNTNRRINYLDDIFNNFFNEINEITYPLLSGSERSMTPRIDLTENDAEFLLEMEIPGIKEENIDLKISNNVLTIEGKKEESCEAEEKNYHIQERYYGAFRRSIGLPSYIKENEISATYKDGILSVKIPKKEQSQTKKIEVKRAS